MSELASSLPAVSAFEGVDEDGGVGVGVGGGGGVGVVEFDDGDADLDLEGEGELDGDAEAEADGEGAQDAQGAEVPKKKRGRRPKRRRGERESSSQSFAMYAQEQEDGSEEERADTKGDAKISKDGALLGGRRFRCESFSLPRHPSRVYVMALDVARLLGYRDTHMFFAKHSTIRRVVPTFDDRDALLDRRLISSKSRNRPFSLLTAHSAFKAFGHRIVHRGRPIRDDYYVGDKPEPEYGPDVDSENDEDVLNDSAHLTWDAADLTSSLLRRSASASTSDAGLSFFAARGINPNDALFKELKELKASSYPPPKPRSGNWLATVYAEAAAFNAKLQRQRKPRFFDVHTGLEHVAVPNSAKLKDFMVVVEVGTLGSAKEITVEEPEGLVQPLPVEAPPTDDPLLNGDTLDDSNINGHAPMDHDSHDPTTMDHPAKRARIDLHPLSPPKPEKEVDTKSWMTLMPDDEDKKYPLALMPGQWQGMFSLHSTRYHNPSAPPQHAPPPAPPGSFYTYSDLHAPPPPLPPTLNNSSNLSNGTRHGGGQIDINEMRLDPRYNFFCGNKTRDGYPCKRPVSTPGEKCIYHKKDEMVPFLGGV